jgi:anti-sigma B factor antagonist
MGHSGELTAAPIEGGWVVTGDIDAHTAPTLTETLLADRADIEGANLVIDLAGVDFIDSCGLAVLVATRRRVGDLGGDLVLRRPSPAVRRLLELTHLDEAFPVEQEQNSGSADSHAR